MILYDQHFTLILKGDSNSGKTTFINVFIKEFTNNDAKFYAETGKNKTKVTTVFSFQCDEYKITYNGKSRVFETFEQLVTEYNIATKNGNIDVENYEICHVYIKGGDLKINIIDTVGKSDIVSEEYQNKMMTILNKKFPNNIKICLARTPSTSMNFTDDFNVITFADTIDYTKDETLEDTHYMFIEELMENKLVFFSNKQNKVMKMIKDKEIPFYGIDSIFDICNKVVAFSKKPLSLEVLSIDNFMEDSDIQNANCIDDVLTKIYKYNDLELYTIAKNFVNGNQLVSKNFMINILHNAIGDREKFRSRQGNGITRSINYFRDKFETEYKSMEFAKQIVSECEEFVSQNKGKSNIFKSEFNAFDKRLLKIVMSLSREFVLRLLEHIKNNMFNGEHQNKKIKVC